MVPFGLTAAASATVAAIQKINYRSEMTALIISNKEMKDNIKIVKSLEESDLLVEGISKTIENEIKEQESWFLSMLLDTIIARLLGNMLAGKEVIQVGDGLIKAGKDF